MNPSTGPLLILSSAILHALWNAILKRAGSGPHAAKVLLRSSALSAWIWFALTRRTDMPYFGRLEDLLPGAVLAGVFEGFYFLFLQKTLLNFPLGWAYMATRGGAMLWVWAASLVWLQEAVSMAQVNGVALVTLGLMAATVGIRHQPTTPTRVGAILAAATSLMIAGYHLTYKNTISKGVEPVALFAVSVLVSCLILEAATWRQKNELSDAELSDAELRVALAPSVLAGVLATASFLLFLQGLGSVGAGISITLRNTSILFAQILGLFMGERLTPAQWLGCALVLGGAMLL